MSEVGWLTLIVYLKAQFCSMQYKKHLEIFNPANKGLHQNSNDARVT